MRPYLMSSLFILLASITLGGMEKDENDEQKKSSKKAKTGNNFFKSLFITAKKIVGIKDKDTERKQIGYNGLSWDNPTAKFLEAAYEKSNLEEIKSLHKKHNVALDALIVQTPTVALAVLYDRLDLLNFLIDQGISPSKKFGDESIALWDEDDDNYTAISYLGLHTIDTANKKVLENHRAILRTLIQQGCDVNEISSHKYASIPLAKYLSANWQTITPDDIVIKEHIAQGALLIQRSEKHIHNLFIPLLQMYRHKFSSDDQSYCTEKQLSCTIKTVLSNFIKPVQKSYIKTLWIFKQLTNAGKNPLPKRVAGYFADFIANIEMGPRLAQITEALEGIKSHIPKSSKNSDVNLMDDSLEANINNRFVQPELYRITNSDTWINDWIELRTKKKNSDENNLIRQAFENK